MLLRVFDEEGFYIQKSSIRGDHCPVPGNFGHSKPLKGEKSNL